MSVFGPRRFELDRGIAELGSLHDWDEKAFLESLRARERVGEQSD